MHKFNKVWTISFILFFYHSFLAFASELEIYPWNDVPETTMKLQNEPVYKTRNLTRSPFMVTIDRVHDELFDAGSEDYYSYWWRYYNESGVNLNFLRVHFQNPTPKHFNNIYVVVQHFVSPQKSKRHRYRRGKGTNVRGKGVPHSTELYKMGEVKPWTKWVFDTEGVEFRFDREGWHGYYYYYRWHSHDYNDQSYAGYIISFIDSRNKLLLQMTNNKSLDEKGIKKISKEMIQRFKKEQAAQSLN